MDLGHIVAFFASKLGSLIMHTFESPIFAGRSVWNTAANAVAYGKSTCDRTQQREKTPRLQLLLLLVHNFTPERTTRQQC